MAAATTIRMMIPESSGSAAFSVVCDSESLTLFSATAGGILLVASTLIVGLAVGAPVEVGISVGSGVWLGTAVDVIVGVGVAVSVAVGVTAACVGVELGILVTVAVACGVSVAAGVSVTTEVLVTAGVLVVGAAVGLGGAVGGAGVTASSPALSQYMSLCLLAKSGFVRMKTVMMLFSAVASSVINPH